MPGCAKAWHSTQPARRCQLDSIPFAWYAFSGPLLLIPLTKAAACHRRFALSQSLIEITSLLGPNKPLVSFRTPNREIREEMGLRVVDISWLVNVFTKGVDLSWRNPSP